MIRRVIRALCVIGVIFISAWIGVYVWPTRFRSIDVRGDNILAARQDRFSGDVELLMRNGWHRAVRDSVRRDTAGYDPLAGYTPNWRPVPAESLRLIPRRP